MTEIVDGELRYNELTINSNGGTELMARRIANGVNKSLLDGVQIICSRPRELIDGVKRILWCHDLANDPEVAKLADPEYQKNFDLFVFVSHWQQNMYNMVLGIPYSKSVVISNAIEPIEFVPREYKDGEPIKLIYHTTPHRGLNILVAVFEHLQQYYNIELDVYSSFGVYGWQDRDQQFSDLFERIDKNQKIRNHGAVSNEQIRQALTESHIFAYPSVWSETSCLALIEAMCSGNFCIHSSLGALPETSKGLTNIYMYNENINDHANEFAHNLNDALRFITGDVSEKEQRLNSVARIRSVNANNYYNLDAVINDWNRVLGKLKQ